MARNKYSGYCYKCNTYVPPGFGHFERCANSWRIQCVKCASGRIVKETDYEVRRIRKELEDGRKVYIRKGKQIR